MVKNYLPNIPIVVPGSKGNNKTGQAGTGRYPENRPGPNNQFEEDEEEGEVTYHQQMKIQEQLKHLSPEALGEVAKFISEHCPQAWEEEGDNAKLYLDSVPLPVFRQLQEYSHPLT